MKLLFAVLIFWAGPMAGAAEHVVTVRYGQGMRIPNHRVVVTIDASPRLTLLTESKNGPTEETIRPIDQASLEALRKELKAIDWAGAARDKVRGLDGAKVRITYQGKEFSWWSPGSDTTKRGLENVQNLVTGIFGMAGLDAAAMPPKRAGAKVAR